MHAVFSWNFLGGYCEVVTYEDEREATI